MQIVIDIEDYDREWIANGYHIPDEINGKIAGAIIDGTPLPEHHGRLIDADELHHKMGEWLKLSHKADESVMVALDDIAISTMMEIEDAPAIIEADMRGDKG